MFGQSQKGFLLEGNAIIEDFCTLESRQLAQCSIGSQESLLKAFQEYSAWVDLLSHIVRPIEAPLFRRPTYPNIVANILKALGSCFVQGNTREEICTVQLAISLVQVCNGKPEKCQICSLKY